MKIRILIVEDDPMVAEINKNFLAELEEFELTGITYTGSEALKLIEKHKPHLILLDLFLPDISGTELLKQARKIQPDIDAIMLTAAKEVPLVQDCLRLGVRDYLIKPYYKEQLHESLREYINFFNATRRLSGELSQEQIDSLLPKNNSKTGADSTPPETAGKLFANTPKGISGKTLEIILRSLKETTDLSAEELAEKIGISVVTARRYLNYLQDEGLVELVLCYGNQGRPIHRYSLYKDF